MSDHDSTPAPENPIRQAVLFAIKPTPPPLGSITDHTPAYLQPLAGRSMADRIAGRLGDLGVTEVTILIAGNADAAASFFDDGTRWGIHIRLVDVSTSEQAVERLKSLQMESPFLLGDLYCFPVIENQLLKKLAADGTTVLTNPDHSSTGWAVLAPDALAACKATTPELLMVEFGRTKNSYVTHDPILSCLSAKDILSSIKGLLSNQVKHQMVSGASGEPGLWIGAGSIIHPTVKIISPVWIGENCRLERGVQLGPNATISDNCVLGEESIIKNTCVLPGTCIGNELELDGTVADRNYLAYADANLTVAIPDSFLIAPNKPIYAHRMIGSLLGRLVALLILLPVLPLLALFWVLGLTCGQRRPIESIQVVRLPAPTDPMLWKTFGNRQWAHSKNQGWNRLSKTMILRILAAIPNIAFGRLHWVGLAPRTTEEIQILPEDWQMLYLSSKPGIFQLAELDRHCSGDTSKEQQFSSEAFYAATQSLKADLKIILRSIFTARTYKAPPAKTAVLTLSTGEDTLDQLHEFLNHELSAKEISGERKDAIITAVHEAMSNIIRHAYELKEGLPIQLHLRKGTERLEFGLFDKGKVFDPGTITEPDFSGETCGGFGWHLINSITDDVGFSRFNGWNHLTLIFDNHEQGEIQYDH